MNKKIVIREIDRFASVTSKDKIISEYAIYYIVDNINVEAYVEIGAVAKKIRVNQILLNHFISDNTQFNEIDFPIEELSYNEVHNIK
jgi:hypothetical protein